MIQDLLETYNEFSNLESLRRKADVWYEKLKDQENDRVRKVMAEWSGSKMPTVLEVLAKCRSFEKAKILPAGELICRYMDYGDVDECLASRHLCANKSDNFPLDAKQVEYCINHRADKKVICYWHRQVILDAKKDNSWTKWMISIYSR